MADNSLAAALSELSLDDLRVDADGRVYVTNPTVAKKISDLTGGSLARAVSDSLNTGTCNNTACLAGPDLERMRRSNPIR